MPRIELERLEQLDDPSLVSSESFDRIAFAERALELVRPQGTIVAIRQGYRRVSLSSGRQWGGARAGVRWAILSVPRDASRRAIAAAVLELATGQPRAWALDVLMRVCE